MPPKQKTGGAKPKTTGKDDGDGLTLEHKYKKALEEIETLKEMLSFNKDLTQHVNAISKQCQERTRVAENKLSAFIEKQAQISSDISRQYKTMQSEVGLGNAKLDFRKLQMHTKNESTNRKLRNVESERDRLREIKDEEIADQRVKIASTGIQYEYLIMDALDNLVDKLDTANKKWGDQALNIQAHHKNKLLGCGHKPLEF